MIKSLEDFKVYNLAMEVGEEVWTVVTKWPIFAQDTVGKQLVKATDSIAANLSEGLGRYHFKEAKNFSYFSRGSLFETRTWLKKAQSRKLLSSEQYTSLNDKCEIVGRMLNAYINSIGTIHEPEGEYIIDPNA